jgi:type I site-specific restriction-modification system R (restriction) subunit
LLIDKIEVILPTFEIDKHYLKTLDDNHYTKEQQIIEMKHALEHHIRINLETNPIYETLSQRLTRILRSKKRDEILAELKRMVEEVNEIEEQTRRMGVTKEEYALLNAAKKYAPSQISESELISFVKELTKRVKGKTFTGWERNPGVVKDVEQRVFDSCYQKFSPKMDTDKISTLTDELMKFVMKYEA